MKKTVIFGGTFNPIHLAHLEIINNVLALSTTEKVIVIPTSTPPHKVCVNLACDADRLEMCKVALGGLDRVEVSDMEIMRGGKSYTYDTLRNIRKENPHAKLALVCGGDMIVSFSQWYRYNDIIKNTEIIAIRRVGIDEAEFDNAVKSLINIGATVNVLKNHITGISSTEIRDNINNREYLLKYLPKSVYEYIKANNLYGDK